MAAGELASGALRGQRPRARSSPSKARRPPARSPQPIFSSQASGQPRSGSCARATSGQIRDDRRRAVSGLLTMAKHSAYRGLPLVYSCSGCSSAAQLANHVAVRLDREQLAEMSCIAGVGGDVESLVRTAASDRPIVALDGCQLQCVKNCLQRHGIAPTLALHALGARRPQALSRRLRPGRRRARARAGASGPGQLLKRQRIEISIAIPADRFREHCLLRGATCANNVIDERNFMSSGEPKTSASERPRMRHPVRTRPSVDPGWNAANMHALHRGRKSQTRAR